MKVGKIGGILLGGIIGLLTANLFGAAIGVVVGFILGAGADYLTKNDNNYRNIGDGHHYIGNDDDSDSCEDCDHEYTGHHREGVCKHCGQYPPSTSIDYK